MSDIMGDKASKVTLETLTGFEKDLLQLEAEVAVLDKAEIDLQKTLLGIQIKVESLQAKIDVISMSGMSAQAKNKVRTKRRRVTLMCNTIESEIAGLLENLRTPTVKTPLQSLGQVENFHCYALTPESASIKWSVPTTSTGSPAKISFYEVVRRAEGDDGDWTECCNTILTTHFTVSNLVAGVNYRLKCRANDATQGWGPWSLLRDVRTDVPVPCAVTNLAVVTVTHSSVTLRWDQVDAGPQDTYELEFREDINTTWVCASSTIHCVLCKKKHLSATTMYWFRVRAKRGLSGWGDWCQPISSRTLSLHETIKTVRRRAKQHLYDEHGIDAATPLPTSSNPHYAMPRFPSPKSVPHVALSMQDPNHDGDNRRLQIYLRRENILEDSFTAMIQLQPKEWCRDLFVKFHEEEGLDYGALTNEWLVTMLDSMALPEFALFTHVGAAGYSHPSPASKYQENHLGYFKLFGFALAKAFLESVVLRVRMSNLVLKLLLNQQAGALVDLEHFDGELHKNLTWMLKNNIEGVIDETFATDMTVLGETTIVEMIPNGGQIPVTEQNKIQFVDFKAKSAMLHGIQHQVEALRSGFNELLPASLLRDFSVADLHESLSGISNISVIDWKKNTDVSPALTQEQISMFWEIVGEMTAEQRSKLLFFATASASPPPGGFCNLRPNKFKLATETMAAGALPTAHACFCVLVLPTDIFVDYESFRHKLKLAANECEGFAHM
eukprot:m.40792 g.40792  ORF g.40792 m.40792 type:complete len:724 (+) comp18615_c0_seq1:74-2245(+)